jgi:hypothetical protein
MKRLSRRSLAAIFLGVPAAIVAALLFVPLMRPPYHHEPPQPPLSFAAAVEEIRAGIAATPPSVIPEGRTILLEHGRPTEHVFVLMHGLSNCPAQFLKFGAELYERGHTVLIPRLPYHGEKDVMTEDWARLTDRDMLETANHSVDLARSLGRKVTAAGLSINGTACAWLAQNRADLHRSVVMAPFLAPAGLPFWAARPMERALLRLPNLFFWWDPRKKGNVPRPPYSYPRFPTHVIGETMYLGSTVLDQARREAALCPSVLVVTTASDLAASNAFTARLVAAWEAKRPSGIETFQFPAVDKVPHDFIDPNQPNQQIALVYPRLIELLEQ